MDHLGPNGANSMPLTPLGFLRRAATIYGDCPSIIYNNTVFTWSQTNHRCLRLASSLSSLGILTGDVVSVIAPNIPEMYEMHFGVPMAGAILNTINTRLDARTISTILNHAESKLIFVDSQYLKLIADAFTLLPPKTNHPQLILIQDKYWEGQQEDVKTVITYEKLIEMGDANFQWVKPKSEWSPMVLNYTSGTTSAPKGVVHCHRGLFLIALNNIIGYALPERLVYLWTLPMFHGNGWSCPWATAALGGTNVCLRHFDGAGIYSAINTYKVTHLCCAPVVLNMLTNTSDHYATPLTHTVNIITGGAPPPAAVLNKVEALGFTIKHAYGLTETAGIAASCVWKREWDRRSSEERARLMARQGVGTLCMEVDVIDGVTGLSVPHDGVTQGEIVLRGWSLMLGYLKNEAATAAAVREDGWFYTGDVGVVHGDGYVEIKDRSKDVIISGGENVSSVEVESVLYGHPAVEEAGVVARPDEHWGETPCAFVSLKDGVEKRPTEREVVEFCRGRLPGFMVPKTVVFLPELPKTATGKIQKYVLRRMAGELGSTCSSRL
ncbi:hypothetical protein J5N97_022985 [Dioscorea zingiberensis]|uniref:4-coumarate--CoA ligase n=1 Tax=Dioscorea zingiberensis TaxID=325984 RepID=A0A9D5CBF9_9LILI|nr:hypothetical protein J5N97_022985 [Dioscorea zingiberensis]